MYSKIILSITLICTVFVGDYVVFRSKMAESFAFRAISDSFVHASIGFFSSLLFFNCNISVSSQAKVYNVVLCTIVSSLIDIDHAFVAKSFHLKDYLHLNQRGIFHCTTFWIIVTSIMLLYSHLTKKINIYVLSWMFILAFTTHHIRDGNRRGLWMYPYGHTPPIPKYLYMFILSILPVGFAYVYPFLRPPDKHTILHY